VGTGSHYWGSRKIPLNFVPGKWHEKSPEKRGVFRTIRPQARDVEETGHAHEPPKARDMFLESSKEEKKDTV